MLLETGTPSGAVVLSSERVAIGDLLRKHGEQYQLEENWCSDWMEDVQYREIEMGAGYRDRAMVDWK